MGAFLPGRPCYLPRRDIFLGIPYWDVGENRYYGYVMSLPHADLPLTQVTIVGSREGPKGNLLL